MGALFDELTSQNKQLKAKEDILYRMARLVRNTDGLHPSTAGPLQGKLLSELRILDNERYDREVMAATTPDPIDPVISFIHALNNPDSSIGELIEKGAACGFDVKFDIKENMSISKTVGATE